MKLFATNDKLTMRTANLETVQHISRTLYCIVDEACDMRHSELTISVDSLIES